MAGMRIEESRLVRLGASPDLSCEQGSVTCLVGSLKSLLIGVPYDEATRCQFAPFHHPVVSYAI